MIHAVERGRRCLFQFLKAWLVFLKIFLCGKSDPAAPVLLHVELCPRGRHELPGPLPEIPHVGGGAVRVQGGPVRPVLEHGQLLAGAVRRVGLEGGKKRFLMWKRVIQQSVGLGMVNG